jgi:hypothetical protein
MATVFPFNQLPTIPTRIQEQLAPVFVDLQLKLVDIALDLQNTIASISVNVACDDVEIIKLRNLIQSLNQIIQTIQTVLSIITDIVTILQIVSAVGQAVSSAALAIPTGPPASISQLITSAAQLFDKIDTFIRVIQTQLSAFTPIFNRVAKAVASADRILINTCGTRSDFVGFDGLAAINPLPAELTLDQLADLYPSNFYNPLNVTDSDIQARLLFIQDLVQQNLDVMQRLNEAPSEIITLSTNPGSMDGKLGDYAINTVTGQVFGPKRGNIGWN